jgi:hypothetical protein
MKNVSRYNCRKSGQTRNTDKMHSHDLRATALNVQRMSDNIARKYNIPLPIAQEVSNHIVTDCWSTLDIEPISDTVFVYYIKE